MQEKLYRIRMPALLLVVVVVMAGCDTPSQRIKQDPEAFASLEPAVQENVRKGNVTIGFSREAVRLALGEPDRTYTRRTMTGPSEVWAYVTRDYRTTRQKVKGEFRVRDSLRNQVRTVRDDVWVNVQNEVEYEHLRIEIQGGIVSAVEEIDR